MTAPPACALTSRRRLGSPASQAAAVGGFQVAEDGAGVGTCCRLLAAALRLEELQNATGSDGAAHTRCECPPVAHTADTGALERLPPLSELLLLLALLQLASRPWQPILPSLVPHCLLPAGSAAAVACPSGHRCRF